MPFKLNNEVVDKHLLHLVPHGVNSDVFKPIEKDSQLYKNRKKILFGDKQYDFVLFYNSRNVHRKRTSNIILAFRAFCDNLTKEQAKKCALVLHTERIGEQGTDLPAVVESICPNYSVYFSEQKIPADELASLYNIASVTISISSNEGFGISVAESMMCGVPVIVNVTGGLQDQIGQTDDDGNEIKFTEKFSTNNSGKYKKHGKWVKTVYPSVRYIQGSVPTPYIFDDICKWEDVAEAIMYWYLMNPDEREKCGLEGRRWAMNEGGINHTNMIDQFIKAMDFTLKNFAPCSSFSLHTSYEHIGHEQPNGHIGIEIPKINIDKIKEEINNTINK